MKYKLKSKYKIILYVSTLILAALSLYSVIFDWFLWIVRIPIFTVAAITLFSTCYFIVIDIKYMVHHKMKPRIASNVYAKKLKEDYRLKTVVFTIPGVMSNIWFALINGVMGIVGQSPWFGSLAAYYILLSIMRIQAVGKERYIRKQNFLPKERMKREIKIYKYNSYLFILLAIVLFDMVLLLEFSIGGKTYPGFMVYIVVLFTFYKIIKSTINILKERKKKSPLMMIIRRIGHVDACVSILTLQTAMFVSFGQGQETLIKMMNGITGRCVSSLVLYMGIQGIVLSARVKYSLEEQEIE